MERGKRQKSEKRKQNRRREGDCFVPRLVTIGNVDANRGIVRNPLRDNSCFVKYVLGGRN